MGETKKSQLKYKVVSQKMNDYVRTTAGNSSSFDQTQTSWRTIQQQDVDQPIAVTDPNTISVIEHQERLSNQKDHLAKTMTEFTAYKTIDQLQKSIITSNRVNGNKTPKLGSEIMTLQQIHEPAFEETSYQKKGNRFDMTNFKGVLAGELGRRRASLAMTPGNFDQGKFLPELAVKPLKIEGRDGGQFRSQSVAPKIRA